MNRARTLAVFLAGAACSLGLVLAFDAARALPREYSPYRKLNLFAQALSYIENHYVDPVDDRRLMQGAIAGMLDTLDPYSTYLSPEDYRNLLADTEGQLEGIGIEVAMRDGTLTVIAPIDGTPAQRAGIRAGDQIAAIAGHSTKNMGIEEAVKQLRGPRGTPVELSLRRPGQAALRRVSVTREVINVESVHLRMITANLAYLRIKAFQAGTARNVARALEHATASGALKGLVLDLRNNPGGLLDQAVRVSDLFIAKGLIVRTMGRAGQTIESARAHRLGTFADVPMVCLVDGGSASAAEIVAAALQDHHRALLLGTRTFGKGSVQTLVELDDGSALKLTIARYQTPSGKLLDGRGLQPDIVQPGLPNGDRRRNRRGGDAQLDAAVERLRPGAGPRH